jgi:tetratricopeptide (TPR) repeat protein
MRRFNVRFFFCVLSTTVVLGLALAVVHRLQAGNIAGALLWQADQAEQAGEPGREARFLSRYLEFRPDDLDERARLAKVLVDPSLAKTPRARNQARFVLEQVLARDAERHDLRKLLVRLLLDSRQPDAAKEHLDALRKALPRESAVMVLQGEAEQQQGRLESAATWYRKAVAAAPNETGPAIKLVRLLGLPSQRKKPGNLGEREQLIEKMLNQAPHDVEVILAAADLAQEQGQLADAEEQLAGALKTHRRESRLYVALARFQEQQDKHKEALATIRRGLEDIPADQHFELDWTLANLLLDGGELDQARLVIDKLKKAPQTNAVEYLQARCAMRQKRWFEAAGTLEKLRPTFKAFPDLQRQVDLYLGKCYEQLNEPGLQKAAFERVLKDDPTNLPAGEGLAKALWSLGRIDESLKCYRVVANVDQPPAELAAKKIELARRLLWSQPATGQNWKLIEQELRAAEALDPQAPEVPILRAEIAFAQGQKDRADVVLAEALNKQPRQAQLWIARALLVESLGDPKKAAALLDEARVKAGDSVDLRLARAQLLARSAPRKTMPDLKSIEDGAGRFNPQDQARLLLGLADLYFEGGSYNEARRLWQALAARPEQAENLQLRLLLFEGALRQGNDAEMTQLLRQIKALEGSDGLWWRYGESLRLIALARRGDKDAAARAQLLLREVAARRAEWPALTLAEADLAQVRGNKELAIAKYRTAIRQGARHPTVCRQLVQLLLQQQRIQEAEQEIEQLKQRAPLTGDLCRLAAAFSLFHKDFDSAERLVRSQIALDSTDYRDYLWLGQVLAARGETSAEAEVALTRAVALDETAPEAWMALIRYLLQTDRADQARQKMAVARAKIKGPQKALFLAQCCEMLDDLEQAGRLYEEALREQPKSAMVWRLAAGYYLRRQQPRQAEKLLRDLIDRKVKSSPQDSAWARQMLALLLADGDDARRHPEALALVGLRLDAKGNVVETAGGQGKASPAEQVTRARVLALQNRLPLRLKAIAYLEDVLQQNALNPDDQLYLARLYLANGPNMKWWGQARDLLARLTVDQPKNPRFLTFYAQVLLDHKDLVNADRVIGTLEQLEKERKAVPGAFGSVVLRAQVLEAAGLKEKALVLLQTAAARPGVTNDNTLQYTIHIGRLGNLKLAVQLCEQVAHKGSLDSANRTAVALLRATWAHDMPAAQRQAWQAQSQRVEGWLQDAIRSEPKNIARRLQLADLYELQGRYDDVEKVCQQVLDINPNHLVALNNLAWLLALRSQKGEQALVLINRALTQYGPRPELLDTRAMTYLALGRPADALPDLQQSVRDDPNATRYFHLTRAYHQAQDASAALGALAQANAYGLSLDRLHPTEHEAYRRILAQLKN